MSHKDEVLEKYPRAYASSDGYTGYKIYSPLLWNGVVHLSGLDTNGHKTEELAWQDAASRLKDNTEEGK